MFSTKSLSNLVHYLTPLLVIKNKQNSFENHIDSNSNSQNQYYFILIHFLVFKRHFL